MKAFLAVAGISVVVSAAVLIAGSMPPQRGVQLPPHSTPTPTPQFRARVDLVHLDVSVLDRDRRPVKGLGPADFTVLENGVPQSVTVFSEVDTPDPVPPKTAWMRNVAPDVRTNADTQQRRIFVIIIDDATLQLNPLAIRNVKTAAEKVVDGLGPSDLAAVIFTADNHHAQDFTSDRARLLAAVQSYHAGPRSGEADDLFFRYSVNTLQSAVKVLSHLPDRRKAIVYIGQGLPVDLSAAFGPEDIAITKPTAGDVSRNPGNQPMTSIGEMARLGSLVADAFGDAARANVTIYPIDVCGLRTGQRAASAAVTADELIGAGASADASRSTCQPGLEVNYLNNLASATGGAAIINTNDFSKGIAGMFSENTSYYVLGYQSTDQRTNGKLRKLDVRVNQPGVLVRTRAGYIADKPDDAKRKAELSASPIGSALAGALPKSDLPMQLTAAPFAVAGKKEATVAVVLGVYQPIRERAQQAAEKIDLVVVAYDVNGKAAGSTRLTGDIIIRADERGLSHYEALASINLKPGRYQLRTAVDVSTLGTNGSVYYDVDVPDFSGAPLSLSGLLVSATPSPVSAPRDALKAIVPVVPTSRRTFRATDQVHVFGRLYQGGKQPPASVTITTQLRNDADELLFDRTQQIEAERFGAARSADLGVDLPVAEMAPGAYLLTVEARVGKTSVKRNLRVTVTR